MTRWIEDIMKKSHEMHRRLELDLQDKYAELGKRIEKERDQTHNQIDRVNK